MRDYTQPVIDEATGLYGPTHGCRERRGAHLSLVGHPSVETPPCPCGSIRRPERQDHALETSGRSLSPMDAANDNPIYIKQGVYQITGDLDAAVNAGVELSGQEYSGEWEAVTELMYFDAQHQVAPAAESLQCADCHSESGRLDFVALGYAEDRAALLARCRCAIRSGAGRRAATGRTR